MSQYHALNSLFHQAAVEPGATALLAPGLDALSFKDLEAAIAQLAAQLVQTGVGPQERVAVICSPGVATGVVCLGVMAAAVCVPLNPDYQTDEYRYFFREIGVGRVVLAAGPESPASRVADELSIPVTRIRVASGGGGKLLSVVGSPEPAISSLKLGEVARGADTALVLHTSGSTAAPKLLALSHEQVVKSARNIAGTLKLSATDRCLNMMPLFHVGGLIDLLLVPLSVGGSVVLTGPLPAKQFYETLAHHQPTWFQGVPTMLSDIRDHALARGLSPVHTGLRLIRAVSSPLDTTLLEQLESIFSAPVLEMYGMSECCGQITSNPLPPAARKAGSVGLPTAVEVQLIDSTGNPVEQGKTGEILVRGATVIDHYEGAAQDDYFIGDWLRTGDQGFLDGDGYLFLTGRSRDIINRGGEKISPLEVDLWLARHPAVREAAAFSMPHASLGQEVAAAIVLQPGASLDEAELRDFARGQLAQFKIPRKIIQVEALPRAPGGKLQRHRLAEAYCEQPAEIAPEHVEPGTELSRGLAAMWEQALGVDRVGLNDSFFDLGGDSLSAAAFLEEFEARYRLSLPGTALFDAPTVGEFETFLLKQGFDYGNISSPDTNNLSDEVYSALLRRSSAWRGRRAHPRSLVIGHNTLGSQQPIYWSADSDSWLSGFSSSLGPDQPVYIMRNAWGMKVFTRDVALLEGTARHFVSEILDLQPTGPYILGGFCEGAKVAVAAARQLLAQGQMVTLLCLVEHSVTEAFDGQVAHYVGRRNRLSPYYRFNHPEFGWRKLFPGDPIIHVYPWVHDDFIQEANIHLLASQLRSDVDTAQRTQHDLPVKPSLQVLQPADYRGSLRLRVARRQIPGTEFRARIKFRNGSDVTWQATELSGISVYARWVNFRGSAILNDRIATLEEPLQPGGQVSLDVNLRTPASSGRWLLEVGLVDEGVAWFVDHGHAIARRRVYAFHPGEVWQRFVNKLRKAVGRNS